MRNQAGKNGLEDVGGHVLVEPDPAHDGEDQPLVAADEHLPGRAFATSAARNEGGIILIGQVVHRGPARAETARKPACNGVHIVARSPFSSSFDVFLRDQSPLSGVGKHPRFIRQGCTDAARR